MLKEFFNQGEDKKLSEKITEIKLPLYQDSGKCRGIAHVQFKDIKTYSYLANNDKGNFSVLKINNTILFKTNRFFYRYS